ARTREVRPAARQVRGEGAGAHRWQRRAGLRADGLRSAEPAVKKLAPLLLVALTASGQVRESVTVEIIEVPVYVSTATGKPIRGIAREAFKLFVNRKEQPIEYFDAVDFATASAPAAPDAVRDLRQRRLYLLLFDQCFAQPSKLARAQRAAASLVAKSNPSTDSFAVATYTSSKGVQF